MTRSEFLRALEVQLEAPKGSLIENQSLTEVENWDSMAGILFIALADERLGVNVPGDQIAKSKTVRDLLSLVGDRLSE